MSTGGHSIVVDVDLWVFIALLLACVILHVRETVKVPTSALLMLSGICLRTIGQYVGMLESAVKVMDKVEAETIMLIFIPALIFECAFSTEWYTFKRELGQIILLATTAVVIASILTAIVIRYVLGFADDFTWYAALMLGAILSATDHVAVVAQLKEVQADKRLETLIQGETLANEGSVIVVFTAMMKGAVESEVSSAAIVSLFFRLSLGGIALGIAFSFGVSLWIKRLINHPVLETLLTFITTYLLFYTADATSLHFSGAIGTVTFGLYMSAYGKILISPHVAETVHEFWEMLGTCIESLILVLGGMLMGHFFMDFEKLEYSDIGALFALFALLHVVRAITIVLHWPLLRLMGYGCSYKAMLVLVMGALKGTISIALSLIVFHKAEFPGRVRDLVLFWSVGVSALSAIFDSMLLRYAVKCLGLESLTNVQENMLVSVTTSILVTTNKEIESMKKKEEYSKANWEQVIRAAGPQALFFDMMKATKNGRRVLQTTSELADTTLVFEQFSKSVNITDEDIVLETRRRFYTTLKGLYWHQFVKGLSFGHSALILIEAANRGLDCENKPMSDWTFVEQKIYPRRVMRMLHSLSRLPLLGRLFKTLEYDYITQAYDVSRNFVRAHEEAEHLLDEMEIDIKKEIFEEVMKEPRYQMELASQFLADNIMDIYPEVYIFVQTKQACSSLLYHEKESIEEAYEQGVITELENSALLTSVDRKIAYVLRHSAPKVPSLPEMLRACYLLKDLAEVQFAQIVLSTKDEVVQKGTVLFAEQAEFRGLYVILKGRVRETGKNSLIDHYPGDVVGVQYLFPYFHRTQSAAEAVISANVAFIPLSHLKEMIRDDESFERKVWQQGAKKVILLFRDLFGPLGLLDASQLNTVIMNSVLEKYDRDMEVRLQYGTLLLNGRLSNGSRAFCFIEGREGVKAKSGEGTVLLRFTEKLGQFLQGAQGDYRRMLSKFNVQDKTPIIKLGSTKLSTSQRIGLSLLQGLVPALQRKDKDQSKVIPNTNRPLNAEDDDTQHFDPPDSPGVQKPEPTLKILSSIMNRQKRIVTPEHSARSSLRDEEDVGKPLKTSSKDGPSFLRTT